MNMAVTPASFRSLICMFPSPWPPGNLFRKQKLTYKKKQHDQEIGKVQSIMHNEYKYIDRLELAMK